MHQPLSLLLLHAPIPPLSNSNSSSYVWIFFTISLPVVPVNFRATCEQHVPYRLFKTAGNSIKLFHFVTFFNMSMWNISFGTGADGDRATSRYSSGSTKWAHLRYHKRKL
jgi:hypothetical protein